MTRGTGLLGRSVPLKMTEKEAEFLLEKADGFVFSPTVQHTEAAGDPGRSTNLHRVLVIPLV